MNYVFLDTCTWINFATGKDSNSNFDYSDANFRLLDDLFELKKSKKIIFLKNEIIDIEFKSASVDALIENYDKNIISQLKNNLSSKIIPHCNDNRIRKILNQAFLSLEEISEPFKNLSKEFNKNVWSLYNDAIQINVSEQLKQKALTYSMNKNHLFFENNKNNINDFLILYSIQEWIQSKKELRNLDETNQEHGIYFVTRNTKDFGIDTKGNFTGDVNISQLIKPIHNLNELIINIKNKQNNKEDFLLYNNSQSKTESELELIIEKLNYLIKLKKEFFLSFLNSEFNNIIATNKIKNISRILTSKHEVLEEGSFPMIRSQNIVNGKLVYEELLMIAKNNSNAITKKGDILMCAYGKKAGEHCINIREDEAYVHKSINIIRLDSHLINAKYFDYFLMQYNISKVIFLNEPSYMTRINMSDFKNISINLPSLEKQRNLVKLFEEKEQEIERDILIIKRKIRLLII